MKKKVLCFLFLIMFLFPINVDANEKKEVKFSSCIDGDTARFIMDKKEIKVRFLAIDTPETNHPKKGEEPYGREAKEYTCDKITNAQKIELEFDDGSDEKDKYNRYFPMERFRSVHKYPFSTYAVLRIPGRPSSRSIPYRTAQASHPGM